MLLSAGEAFDDLVIHGLRRLPRPGEELRAPASTRTVGGGAVITAVAAARAGCAVRVLTALGPEAVARLSAENLAIRNLYQPGETPALTVALSTRRDRAFVTVDGANTHLESRLLDVFARPPRVAHLHLALGPRDLPAWTRVLWDCRDRGIGTSWDFGWHEGLPRRRGFAVLLEALDWVFVNEREARLYTGTRTLAAAERAWRARARRVVIKQGARGVVALVDGARLRMPAPRVNVVDTTGAGDAFNGGFLAALLAGRPLAACLRAGVRMGSRSVTAAGGLDGLPHA